MREVPYFTTDDESKPCGHIWKQRQHMGGPWGFAWEVTQPYGDEPIAGGWRRTQEEAEKAMNEVLERA